jgi:hypothetical protein
MKTLRTLIVAAVLLCCGTALALPTVKSISDTDVDATVTLKTWDKYILGDTTTWGQVRFVDTGKDVKFSSGDTVEIWVYEDDTAGDEELWHTKFTLTGAEVSANGVDRTFDFVMNIPDDVGSESELYVQAEVVKDDCGTFCSYDRPETAVMDVAEADDDGREGDDTSGEAKPLGLGATGGLICRDQDWHSFEVMQKSDVVFTTSYLAMSGKLDIVLYDAGGSQLMTGVDATDANTVDAKALGAGTYRFRVSPRETGDFNFYDVQFSITTIPMECTPGQQQSDKCGNCGTTTRTCSDAGQWGDWTACAAEGECAAGAEKSDACGKCGTLKTTCSVACAWVVGTCAGEGVCAVGDQETEDCTGATGTGKHQRLCTEQCAWGEWSECAVEPACADGATKPCYSGPEGTKGVGECKAGVNECAGGTWGTVCQGEVVPATEACADDKDNDCDGATDDADTECKPDDEALGKACTSGADCPDLDCFDASANPRFAGGYCSKTCSADADCGDSGVCVAATDTGKVCVRTCATATDCREGYVCAPAGGGKGCLPRCTTDVDCFEVDRPYCHADKGMCLKAAPAGTDTAATTDTATVTDNGTAGTDTATSVDAVTGKDTKLIVEIVSTDASTGGTTGGGSSGGCNAGAASGTSAFLLAGVASLLAAFRRRRGA